MSQFDQTWALRVKRATRRFHPLTQSLELPLIELDDEWEQISVDELHQLDALCDQFEQSIAQDPKTRVESFLSGLTSEQQGVLVRELVRLEIEHRSNRGESLTADEYGIRFPEWAEEIQALALQTISELELVATTRRMTIDLTSSGNGTDTTENELHAEWSRQWQASSAAAQHFDLPADGVLGHYRLQSVIGRGGMGLVVRARDTRLHRDVAIKVLACTFSHDETAHARFLSEARAAAAVQHTHVVTIYAVEEIDGIPFLVMELVEGTTLDGFLQDRHIPEVSEIVNLAHQMAEGLAAAHKQSLTHRDIKPANILLEKLEPRVTGAATLPGWHVKITDFGLAHVTANRPFPNSGMVAGTPQYMSPEQANGLEIDGRSDLFSLGSVMYTMCCGQPAFNAKSPRDILQMVAQQTAPSLKEVSPQTPDWLNDIIERLMQKSPADRFQSADEVAELLATRIREQQGDHAVAPAITLAGITDSKPPLSRLVAAGFAGFLAIAAGIFFLTTESGGTIRFEINDPEIHVSFAGNQITIDDGEEKYRFAAGEHALSVQHGDLAFKTNEFKLGKGEEVRLQVTFLDSRLAIERDGRLLWVGSDDGAAGEVSEARVTVAENTLKITGRNIGDSDDYLTITFSDGNYTITDRPDRILNASSIAGATGSGTPSVTIPQEGIQTINIATLAGRDKIFVNSLAPGVNILIDGGDNTDTVIWNNSNQVSSVDVSADAILVNSGIDSAKGNVHLNANAQVDLATPCIHLATPRSSISTSGTGNVSLTTTRDIELSKGSKITTADGNITLNANRQAIQSVGAFYGIQMTESLVQATGSGNIIMNGRGALGGLDSSVGVSIIQSTVRTNTGAVTLNGIGGTNPGLQNNGAQVHMDAVVESTGGGSIDIVGTAGSTGYGIRILFNGRVQTTGTGHITLSGTGGAMATALNWNYGVGIDSGTDRSGASVVNSGSGKITINATNVAGAEAPAFFTGREGTNRVGFDGTNPYSGDILINADSFEISDAIIQTANSVTLRPTTDGLLTDLKPDEALHKLGLTDAELEQIYAGTLTIGSAVIPHDNRSPRAMGSGLKNDGQSNDNWPENQPVPAIIPFSPAEAHAHQAAWARHLGVPVEIENSIGMRFRVIPAGEFLMGSSQQEIDREIEIAKRKSLATWVLSYIPFEGPQHRVTLTKPFGISIHEVTRGQFRQFVAETNHKTDAERNGQGGEGFKDRRLYRAPEFSWNSDLGFQPMQTDDHPVVNVSPNDAAEFCKWLSKKEGAIYRLPREAEWEFACRAGNAGRFCYGDDESKLHDYAWLDESKDLGASQVGQKQANAFALFDMHGNVWEWCQDWHGSYPSNPTADPVGPETGDSPVGRGGAWGGYDELCRSAFRSFGSQGAYSVGFRVVRTLNIIDQSQDEPQDE